MPEGALEGVALDLKNSSGLAYQVGLDFMLDENWLLNLDVRWIDIDTEGVVFARYTNGQSSALGKVALAKFNNQQGLRQVGDTNWVESFQSGTPQLGEAGAASFGLIQAGGLDFAALPEGTMDSPLGYSTGAADIFANTGGVMEAALRIQR